MMGLGRENTDLDAITQEKLGSTAAYRRNASRGAERRIIQVNGKGTQEI